MYEGAAFVRGMHMYEGCCIYTHEGCICISGELFVLSYYNIAFIERKHPVCSVRLTCLYVCGLQSFTNLMK